MCVGADILQKSMGMPWCLGCCCAGPLVASTLVRYQNRTRGYDVAFDLIVPSFLLLAAYGTNGIACICLAPYLLGKIMRAKKDAEDHPQSLGYLRS